MNPNCESSIEIVRMAILDNAGGLIYEGQCFRPPWDDRREIVTLLGPHHILPITLSQCFPKQHFGSDATPNQPWEEVSQWMDWCCTPRPATLMYTLEISYAFPSSTPPNVRPLPLIGWQMSSTIALNSDGTRSTVSPESQMITYP